MGQSFCTRSSMINGKDYISSGSPRWPSVTNKYKLGALPGFMEIPAGSQEDERHKQATYFTPVIFSRRSSGFQSFPHFSKTRPAVAAVWLFVNCTCELAGYFHTFAFLPKFDFQKIAPRSTSSCKLEMSVCQI